MIWLLIKILKGFIQGLTKLRVSITNVTFTTWYQLPTMAHQTNSLKPDNFNYKIQRINQVDE